MIKILILILGFLFVRWCLLSGIENLSVESVFWVLIGAAVGAVLLILAFKWGFELIDSSR